MFFSPQGVGSIARWLVPFKLRLNPRDFQQGSNAYATEVYVGYNKLSRGRVKQVLQTVITKGDPVVAIEILFTSLQTNKREPLIYIPTKASLVLQALEADDESSILYNGPLPDFRRDNSVKKIFAFIRWWFFPWLILFACWALWKDPQTTLSYTPCYMNHKNVTIKDVLPPHPETISSAFQFGKLLQQFESLDGGKESLASDAILLKAATLFGKKAPLTVEEFQGVEGRIREIEEHKGVVARVTGFFTFVNTMWLLAIAGMLVSFGPAIYAVLRPFRELLERIIKTFVRRVLIPLAEHCHEWGVFELLSYFICWMFVAEGLRSPPETGFYISLTGLGGLVPAFMYSTLLHGKKVSKEENRELLTQLMNSWLAACWVPLAIYYQSNLIGYLVVCAIYAVLGFNIACYGLCYCIGFTKKEALHRCVASSILLLSIFTILRIQGFERNILLPFGSAVSVIGSLVLFLGLLIYSSKYYRYHANYRYHHAQSFIVRQVYMIVSLLVVLLVGSLFNFEGMFNTGIVFLVLYLIEKYTEIHLEADFSGWVLIFILSVFLYKAALWLHQNPAFVASLFNSIM